MKKAYLLYLIPVFCVACNTHKKATWRHFKNLKYEQIHQAMIYPMILAKQKADQDLMNLKIKVKEQGNTKAGLHKIMLAEYLKKETMDVTGEITKRTVKFLPYSTDEGIYTVKQFLSSKHNYYSAQGLAKALNNYTKQLKKRHLKYLKDTIPWAERYLQLIPPIQHKNAPSFGEFYFKNASRHEAVLILYAIEFAVLKEASDIFERISKDN
ncbi:hypothetical protein [Microscilla marina]|nr:hypothetical protein [Microscilla marina]